jgi:ribosome-binding protein aMBF1 (putative translation factor)
MRMSVCENCGEETPYPCEAVIKNTGLILCNLCYDGISHEHDQPDDGEYPE